MQLLDDFSKDSTMATVDFAFTILFDTMYGLIKLSGVPFMHRICNITPVNTIDRLVRYFLAVPPILYKAKSDVGPKV